MRSFIWGYLERNVKRFEKMLEEYDSTPVERSGGFRVMSFQLTFEALYTVEEAMRFFIQRLKEASKYSPHVVVFPRFFGNFFMGMVPLSGKKLKTDRGIRIIDSYGMIFRSAYIAFLRRFAVLSRSVVVGGTILLPEGKEEYYVVSESGEIVASGGKNSAVRAFEVGGLKCSFIFPEDLKDYKKARAAMEEGVRMIFTTETLERYDEWEMKKGIWARSQSLGIFGVNSALNGEFLGRNYEGISFVSAPAVLTKKYDGFVVKLSDPRGKGIAIADIDLSALESYISSLPKTYKRWTLGVR